MPACIHASVAVLKMRWINKKKTVHYLHLREPGPKKKGRSPMKSPSTSRSPPIPSVRPRAIMGCKKSTGFATALRAIAHPRFFLPFFDRSDAYNLACPTHGYSTFKARFSKIVLINGPFVLNIPGCDALRSYCRLHAIQGAMACPKSSALIATSWVLFSPKKEKNRHVVAMHGASRTM